MDDDDGTFALNGIDGATGHYVEGPASLDEVVALALSGGVDKDRRAVAALKASQARPDFGVRFGVQPEDLDAAGWGVVVGRGVPEDHVTALAPLLSMRSEQAGARYRVFANDEAPAPDETGLQWLARHRMGPGPADPAKVPYYLLAVGTPQQVGFDWQHDLDTQYAVGRLDLAGPAEFTSYASTVVDGESALVTSESAVAMFAPRNAGDRATALSNRLLVAPLAGELAAGDRGVSVTSHVGVDARKDRLAELVAEGPRVLLTASHGIEFAPGHPRQRAEQGAVVCQDWPGPLRWQGEIPAAHVYSALDVPSRVSPRVVVLFACYGAGTPTHDRFASEAAEPKRRAEVAFSARLPARLLAAPDGGALAVIAHVDRVWGCSFSWPGVGPQVDGFTDAIRAMLAGYRVGHALEPFDLRYAQLADSLAQTLVDLRSGAQPDPAQLARTWTAAQDARSYVLLGDPAVRVAPTGGLP